MEIDDSVGEDGLPLPLLVNTVADMVLIESRFGWSLKGMWRLRNGVEMSLFFRLLHLSSRAHKL